MFYGRIQEEKANDCRQVGHQINILFDKLDWRRLITETNNLSLCLLRQSQAAVGGLKKQKKNKLHHFLPQKIRQAGRISAQSHLKGNMPIANRSGRRIEM